MQARYLTLVYITLKKGALQLYGSISVCVGLLQRAHVLANEAAALVPGNNLTRTLVAVKPGGSSVCRG
jgi:hypothetical protein